VRELKRDNFGLLIAYLLPGSVALWGASYHVVVVRDWLTTAPAEGPSIGGFLHATLASTALGLVISAVRWALIDRLLARAGVRQPAWDFELFAERLAAYEWLVANHYRYYQFYANMLVALACAYVARLAAIGDFGRREGPVAAGFLLVEVVLLLGARDALRKYYARTRALLARRNRRRRKDGARPVVARTSSRGPKARRATSDPADRTEAAPTCPPSGQSTAEQARHGAAQSGPDAGASSRRREPGEGAGGGGSTGGRT
jgi:uncharacterized membrane protein YgcG